MLISKRDGARLIEYIKAEQKEAKAAEDYEKKRRGDSVEEERKEINLEDNGDEEALENPCGGKEEDERDECEADFVAAKAEKERKRKKERDEKER
jgi:hypothetical protein